MKSLIWGKPGVAILLGLLILSFAPQRAEAASKTDEGAFGIRIEMDGDGSPQQVSKSLKILMLMTVLSLAPSAIVMMTSFTRVLIVLGFLRSAMGTQGAPPGQVLSSMAVFLTIFIMFPVWTNVSNNAIKPYMAEEISETVAWERGIAPIRRFMLDQTGGRELELFVEMSQREVPETAEDVALDVLIPAFMLSELKTAFQMGFLVFLPFLVIDLVIASSLMSLGMMMLPPMMISMPIKILFFVLADGWTLVIRGIVSSYSL
jgi:flagellar biosynthetic protein FliP